MNNEPALLNSYRSRSSIPMQPNRVFHSAIPCIDEFQQHRRMIENGGSDVSPNSKVFLCPCIVIEPNARVIMRRASCASSHVDWAATVAFRCVKAIAGSKITMVMPSKENIHPMFPQQIFKFCPHCNSYSIVCPVRFGVVHGSVTLNYNPRRCPSVHRS